MLSETDLMQFTGTDEYHRWSILFRNVVLTDGAKFVADNGGGHGAYWLMDAIASYQPRLRKHRDVRLQEIQFWNLAVKDGQGILTCRADSGEKPVITQRIDYTDFDRSIDLWVEPSDDLWVILLPSEH
jgi:hypothetical protein